MKQYNSILKYIFIVVASLFVIGCVHDDKYDEPTLDDFQCRTADYYTTGAGKGLTKWTLTTLKTKAQNAAIVDKAYIEGYVSSSDETGNIYKTIYIQDSPTNPTEGLTVSVDAVSTYTKFPQGSKVYIDLEGLALTTYGGVIQLGMITPAGTRIPEKEVSKHVFRDCNVRENITPKVLTLSQFAASTNLIGCLVQINDVEFDSRALCSTYAPTGTTVDKTIGEGWDATNKKYLRTAVVRNSGYASFANQLVPAGKGKFVGIFSKYNSTYQMYINRTTDLDMEGDKNGDGVDEHFPRLDGIAANPCGFNPATLTAKTVADVKQFAAGTTNWVQITGDFYLKAQVVANDETGNLYKYIYVEDATGGIRVNINKTDLYLESRFKLGKDVNIKLKNLYVRSVNGEIQLGDLFNNNTQFGQIEEANMYKYFFDSNLPSRAVVPTERTISQLTTADVGRWIKIKDVQFINSDLGKTLTDGTATTNRTLEDCSGKTILLRTSGLAVFGDKKPATVELEGGKGDAYAILSVFNGTYQLWITKLANIDFDNTPRCDGSVYTPIPVIFSDDFSSGFVNWTAVNVAGAQVWGTSNQGNGSNYYAVVNGVLNNVNEDWLVSKEVSLVGKTQAILNFTTDVRYSGSALQVYATDNYTGTPSTTTWTQLSPTLDTNSAAFGDWVGSGNVSLNAFLGKNVRIAFKYTSTASAAATWEVDDFKIKAQ
ncbi:DUF5689 domain-containing protein [Chryseobacterium gwangjuense]|uniref:DUF5689 domain-containing protein n=1 Tax=Chryseobacterium gwangjuense TaxID=1069980 RepID=UPI001E43D1EF|nr:DUF5689 domain-containing protein [Chryseobacterium gwangjuense]MCE3075387.1 DUF5689 domain-containing protein [Chryseobacterium gwangjuense]